LVINNVDALEFLRKTLLVALHLISFLTQEENFGIRLTDSLLLVFLILFGVRVEGKLAKTGGKRFILGLQAVDLILSLRDGGEQKRVRLFALKELAYQLLHISHLSCGLNSLECIIDILRALHFLFHLFAHESVPQFVDV